MIRLSAAVIIAGLLSACGGGASIQPEPVGKFALITARGGAGSADTVYKVDTVTGETWRLVVAGWQAIPDAP